MPVKFKWGEQEEEEEEKLGPSRQSFVSGPDKDGVKTITEYGKDESTGKTLQIIRKVKETKTKERVKKGVAARRQWQKFGKCAGLPPGPEAGVTTVSPDNVILNLRCRKREDITEDEDPLRKLADKGSMVTCSLCGEKGHWNLKCPKRGEIVVPQRTRPNEPKPIAPKLNDAKLGKYVPLHLRDDRKTDDRKSDANRGGREEETANQLRVTNLSEDTTEGDLRELFGRFGQTTRIYLAKDKDTEQSRGFAFISFTSRDAAQKALERLNGYGYGNLILHVEFAKPREEDGAKTQGAGTRPGWTMSGTK